MFFPFLFPISLPLSARASWTSVNVSTVAVCIERSIHGFLDSSGRSKEALQHYHYNILEASRPTLMIAKLVSKITSLDGKTCNAKAPPKSLHSCQAMPCVTAFRCVFEAAAADKQHVRK